MKTSPQFQNSNQSLISEKNSERVVFNVVVKQPCIVAWVKDFNKGVKNKVFFNVIDFQTWNKHLTKAPVLKTFINFRDLSETIIKK